MFASKTSSALNTVAIEPKSDSLLICGSIDTKPSIFDFNAILSEKEMQS